MAGVDGEGGEDGEDVLAEGFPGPGEAGFIQCGDRAEKDVFLGEGGRRVLWSRSYWSETMRWTR